MKYIYMDYYLSFIYKKMGNDNQKESNDNKNKEENEQMEKKHGIENQMQKQYEEMKQQYKEMEKKYKKENEEMEKKLKKETEEKEKLKKETEEMEKKYNEMEQKLKKETEEKEKYKIVYKNENISIDQKLMNIIKKYQNDLNDGIDDLNEELKKINQQEEKIKTILFKMIDKIKNEKILDLLNDIKETFKMEKKKFQLCFEKCIEKYKNSLPELTREKIDNIQNQLLNLKNNYTKNNNNCIKQNITHTFGDKIDNDTFIEYIQQGCENIYSWNQKKINDLDNFFKDVKYKDFLCIPLLSNDDDLSEIKKHLFIGLVSNQKTQINAPESKNILSSINLEQKTFTDYHMKFKRNKEFLDSITKNNFNNEYYSKETITINLSLSSVSTFIQSKTSTDNYLNVCKSIFGEDADFVNKNNIEKCLKKICKDIVNKIKKITLPQGYYGVTIYSKKIFISNIFDKAIEKKKR